MGQAAAARANAYLLFVVGHPIFWEPTPSQTHLQTP